MSIRPYKMFGSTAFFIVAVAALGVLPTTAAQATTPTFQLPFPCGEVWNGATRADHPTGSGTHYALDFNKGSGSADLGEPVLASAAGTVTYTGGTLGSVRISHGDGWETRYLHLDKIYVRVGDPVTTATTIGTVGKTGTKSSHLHYEQRLGGALKPIVLNGLAAPYVYAYNGPAFISQNCAGSSGTPDPSLISDGSYIRIPDGTIYIVAGKAKYALSYAEWSQLGQPGYVSVSTQDAAALGAMPANGTLLREAASGFIYQIAGGAKYLLTPAEWQALGSPSYVNVPVGFIDSVSATVPEGPIFLRNVSNGEIFQIVAGARYLLTPAEWQSLGSPAYTNVPIGFIDRVVDTIPTEPVFLRDGASGRIFVIAGGAKYLLSFAEWQALGAPGYVDVPIGFIERITALLPEGPILLRNVANEYIYEVIDGTKRLLTYAEWAAMPSQEYVNVPAGWLDLLVTIG